MSRSADINRDDAEDVWLAAIVLAPAYMEHGRIRERHLSSRGRKVLDRARDLYDEGWDRLTVDQLRLDRDVLRSIPARLAQPEAQATVAEAEASIINAWAKTAYADVLRRAADVAARDGLEAADTFLWKQGTAIRAAGHGIEWRTSAQAVEAWLTKKRKRLEQLSDPEGELGCGIEAIDRACGHFAPKRMTLLFGYTNDGKSTLALELMDALAIGGRAGCVISLEDDIDIMGGRLVAIHIDDVAPLMNLDASNYGPEDIAAVEALVKQGLEQLPLELLHRPGWTTDQVVDGIYDAGRRGARVIAVDYVQKLVRLGEDPAVALEIHANRLKDAAAAIGAHLILISQIPRPPGDRKERDQLPPPTLFSAKGSGGLENAAETVLAPFRREKDKHAMWEPAEVLVLKVKDGKAGPVPMWWDVRRHIYVTAEQKAQQELAERGWSR